MASLRERWTFTAAVGADPVVLWGVEPAVTDVAAFEPSDLPTDAISVANRVVRIRWRPDLGSNSSSGLPNGVGLSLTAEWPRRWLDVAISHLATSATVAPPVERFIPQIHWDVVYPELHPVTEIPLRADVQPAQTARVYLDASSSQFVRITWYTDPDPINDVAVADVFPTGFIGPFLGLTLARLVGSWRHRTFEGESPPSTSAHSGLVARFSCRSGPSVIARPWARGAFRFSRRSTATKRSLSPY